MTHDAINNWIEKAKQVDDAAAAESGVRVIRNPKAPSRGAQIMEIAEKLRPWFAKMFEGVRDENGMLVQPARVRGIALNVAQRIVQEEERKLAHG
ncbi:MAG: hypothetical protein LW823_02205 [Rickettsiales bacterium]|jgi:hypothetical protein|nr:hypothetical protein [Rickettsiales bacterium]